ncbi:beta-lactamase family protein [Thermoleptolyngbya oregonensis NK1-22]|uniref:Beta-lactamase family protein n=1 Tax=Thermoleptolyngbya oregonensis NK1-22 TaxID=2547457 RepID=A0AA96YP45_9CYAN|nr:serine hydrolase domain-containing protein [Thermoleptolyngbya oregonensis]WOB43792.1 beta-lactamase family protein [Thermoleptolyngbya oregonensis NK1-22]
MTHQNLEARVRATVERELQEAETPGAAIALLRNGETLLEAGVGYADLQQQIPLPSDARFYIYSITKPLLATVAMNLVQAGRLDLDTSLAPQFAQIPYTVESPVALRQLLSHTGGIPGYGDGSAYVQDLQAHPQQAWTTETFLRVAQDQGQLFLPGKGWAYSNIGYLLLRLILAQETGLSMPEYLHEWIFHPLGLRHTFVPETLEQAHGLTPGYSQFLTGDETGDALQNVAPLYHPGWVSHGVVISTAAELGKIMDALFAGRLLEPERVCEMLEPIQVFDFEHPQIGKIGYGLGLCLGLESPYGTVAGHNGAGPGYVTGAFYLSNVQGQPTTVVALANRDRHDLDLGTRIVFAILRALTDAPD